MSDMSWMDGAMLPDGIEPQLIVEGVEGEYVRVDQIAFWHPKCAHPDGTAWCEEYAPWKPQEPGDQFLGHGGYCRVNDFFSRGDTRRPSSHYCCDHTELSKPQEGE